MYVAAFVFESKIWALSIAMRWSIRHIVELRRHNRSKFRGIGTSWHFKPSIKRSLLRHFSHLLLVASSTGSSQLLEWQMSCDILFLISTTEATKPKESYIELIAERRPIRVQDLSLCSILKLNVSDSMHQMTPIALSKGNLARPTARFFTISALSFSRIEWMMC